MISASHRVLEGAVLRELVCVSPPGVSRRPSDNPLSLSVFHRLRVGQSRGWYAAAALDAGVDGYAQRGEPDPAGPFTSRRSRGRRARDLDLELAQVFKRLRQE